MATYRRIWGGTTSIQISSLRLNEVLGVGFFLLLPDWQRLGTQAVHQMKRFE